MLTASIYYWKVSFLSDRFCLVRSKLFPASCLFLHTREIFRVLNLMRADMVNCTIENLRPVLQRQSVEYERAKFQSILDKTPSEWTRSYSSYITCHIKENQFNEVLLADDRLCIKEGCR